MSSAGTAPAVGCVVAPAAVAEPVYLTADEAGARIRASGRAVRQWAQHGCTVAGQVVRLASILRGTRYLFTPAACDQFLKDCTAARDRAAAFTHAGDREPAAVPGAEEWAARLAAQLGR